MKSRLGAIFYLGLLLGNLFATEELTHKALVETFTIGDKIFCSAVVIVIMALGFLAGKEQSNAK